MTEKLDIEASLSKLSPEARARVQKILEEEIELATMRKPLHDKSYDRETRLAETPVNVKG
jgi:hypothetical protein